MAKKSKSDTGKVTITRRAIIALKVKDILDEQIAYKLA